MLSSDGQTDYMWCICEENTSCERKHSCSDRTLILVCISCLPPCLCVHAPPHPARIGALSRRCRTRCWTQSSPTLLCVRSSSPLSQSVSSGTEYSASTGGLHLARALLRNRVERLSFYHVTLCAVSYRHHVPGTRPCFF